MRKHTALVLITLCFVAKVGAIGPHEVAVIVNGNSASSLRVSREYSAMRSIPYPNIVSLNGIDEDPGLVISEKDFVEKIWEPVNAMLKERGINKRVLAWIYSSGFPTTVTTEEPISLTGMTFLRATVPKDKAFIEKALYASPLFADPIRPDARAHRSRSFDRLRSIHRKAMPLPAFLLAYTGARGNTATEVQSYLKRSIKADFTSPTGTVYFVRSKDIRSEAREWQFPQAMPELRRQGISPVLVDSPPTGRTDILGIMAGTPNIEPERMGSFLPGSFADHLTSFGAYFQSDEQTKCTAWLRAGAAGSAGTVVEPLSAWPKFPHARIFVHYAAGCTLIESFYQSVRSPLQILPIGDPLCQPWAPRPTITLEGLPNAALELPVTLSAEAAYDNPIHSADIEWYLDGKYLGKGERITVVPADLTAGAHTLRIVALKTGSIRSQGFVLKEFTVADK